MDTLINNIRTELIRNADEKTRIQGEKYFKENIKIYGLKAAQIEQIGKKYYKTIADKSRAMAK